MKATEYARKSGARGGLSGKRVLLVEDNEINRQIARELLEEAGIEVIEAVNGRQCVDIVSDASVPDIDLVLMDMQMPVMDGIQATRAIRENSRHSGLPIIAMTANAMEQDRQKCLEAGMNDHLAKPVNVEQMFACLRRWLGDATVADVRAEPRAVPEESLPPLPGVDHAQGLMRVGHNSERLRKAWQKFESTQSDCIERMADASKAGDWENAARMAHTLKGLAATLGANAISTLASELEETFKQPSSDVSGLLAALREQFTPLIAALPAMRFRGTTKRPRSTSMFDRDQVANLLDSLKTQIDDDDTRAARTLDELENLIGNEATSGALRMIRSAINDYNFEQAAPALSQLRAAILDTLDKDPSS